MADRGSAVERRWWSRRGACTVWLLGTALLFGPAAGCAERPEREGTASSDTTLSQLIAELQPEVERSSGLMARTPPRVAVSTRDQLEAYLLGQLEEQLPEEKAAAVASAYARFGLFPDTLDLHAVLVELYKEQVVGYYDPRADTLFVLDHVDADQLELVLAHELVHALQDQYVDLDSLTRSLEGSNDRGTAAQAAIEGHATLAMLEWQMGKMMGQSTDVTQLPDLGAQFAGLDLAQLGEAAGLPVLSDVPRVLREALVFPYVGGLVFVQRLWKQDPSRPIPFGENLPNSTEQLLHWDRFKGSERDQPLDVVFTEEVPAGWDEVYADGLGELETRIFFEEHLRDEERASAVAEGWDGDQFRLLRGRGGEVMIWVTALDGEGDASEFAGAVQDAYDNLYGAATGPDSDRRVQVWVLMNVLQPTVLVVDAPTAFEVDPDWNPARFELRSR
jgi:hypothetical protein